MTVNAKTRNRKGRAAYAARQAAQAQATRRHLLGDELDHETRLLAPEPTAAPTSALYRMVGTGATGHKGKEVAMLQATGQVRSVRRSRSKDAAGPLREQVGCTLQRGGPMDYLERPTERAADTGNATTNAPHRAARIATYQANRPTI